LTPSPPEVKARGVMITSIIPSIPWLIFPPVGGWLIDKYGVYGFRLAHILSGLTGMAAATLRTKFLMETFIEEKIKRKISPIKAIYQACADVFKVLNEMPRQVVYILNGNLLISGLSTSTCNSYAVVFASEYINISREAWGLFNTIGAISSMILTLALLPYLDKLPRKIIIASGLTFTLTVYTLSLMKYWCAFASVILASIAWSIQYPIWQTYMGDIVKRELRGRVNAIVSVAITLGLLWSTLISGHIYTINPLLAFQVSIIACIIEVTYWAITLKEPRIRHL